jgi:nucleoside-diphosphate-sugar epimerase
MRILVIGGTGFIGSFVVRDLLEQGHQVAVYHRGKSKAVLPEGVREILGDRAELGWHKMDFVRFLPDVVIDCILSSERQAKGVMEIFHGVTKRIVAVSSQDVYRAYGIAIGKESGPLQSMPLTEESELRTHLDPYPDAHLRSMRQVFPWIDSYYDKIPVERVVLGDEKLAGTVLRLPMVHGPGDPLHRFHPALKRIDDGRAAILIQEDLARWGGARGYVENMAAAITLAATSPKATGRVYNVAEPHAYPEGDWLRMIGETAGWNGEVIALPKEKMPAHLRVSYKTEQHWIVSSARIREELGYSERVGLREGMRRTIEWERANPPAGPTPGIVDSQFDYAAEDAALLAFKPSAF